MARPKTLDVIRDYGQLIDSLRARRRSLGLSQLDVDHIAGMPEGYCGKIENYANAKWGRNLGPVSMALLMGALEVELVMRDISTNQRPDR